MEIDKPYSSYKRMAMIYKNTNEEKERDML